MSQSKLLSVAETVTNTTVGYVVAIGSQVMIFPYFGIHIPFHDNLMLGAFFTVISLIRGYIIRRWFNGFKFSK